MNRKPPKCKIGFPCGKTCISRKRLCWANLSTNENRLAETFSQFVNRLVGVGIADIEDVVREPTIEETEELISFFKNSNFFQQKLDKVIKEYGLEEKEAMGLALWISNEYNGMNRLLYEETDYNNLTQNQKKYAAAIYYANKALKSERVPNYSIEGLVKLAEDKNLNGSVITNRNDGYFYRGINLSGKLKSEVLKTYIDNVGGEYTEKTFFASTAFKPDVLDFTIDSNILFKIKPKQDSSGKLVDGGKFSMFEAEVLFAPNTRFKISRVDTEITQINKYLREKELDKIYKTPSLEKIKSYIPDQEKYKSLYMLESLAWLNQAYKSARNDLLTPTAIKYIKDRFPELSESQIMELLTIGYDLSESDIKNAEYMGYNGGIQTTEKYTISLEEI